MFLYCGVGFALFRAKIISKEGSKSIANLLIYVILPCAIIKSFLAERTAQKLQELAISFGLGLLALLLAMVVAAVLFRKNPVENFSAAFSNAGFMGIPLITAVMGGEGVFYIAGMVAMLNVLQWSYGQQIMAQGKVKLNVAAILKNPLLVALLLGLALFGLGLTPPDLAVQCVSSLAGCNAPVAMVVLGLYLGEANLKEIVSTPRLYWVSATRLLLIPLVTMLILWLIPAGNIRLAVLVSACAPVGSNVAMYAQKMGRDYIYAVKIVCLSTLLSLITMPVILTLAEELWN